MASAYSYDQMLEAGVAAWLWQNNQLDAAIEAMQPVMMRSASIKFIQGYINWLDAQFETDANLRAIDQALAQNDYARATQIMGGLRPSYALMPFLKERVEPLRREMANYSLLEQARSFFKDGQRKMAGSLVHSLLDQPIPDRLRVQAAALAAELESASSAEEG